MKQQDNNILLGAEDVGLDISENNIGDLINHAS